MDTQSFRQPITEHQIVFGRCRTSGPVVFLHSATDDEGRADGFLHVVVALAARPAGAHGRRDGTAEHRYTVNGAVTLGEGKIAITRKLVAAMAGALVVSDARFLRCPDPR